MQAFGQYTQVPDPNFEQALIDLGIDSEGILDGQFLTADAETITLLEIDNNMQVSKQAMMSCWYLLKHFIVSFLLYFRILSRL